jgi:hypothetical protein
MPAALVVLAIIFGICIFGTALLNIGVGGIILCILIPIACIWKKIADKRRERIEELSGRDECIYKNGGID